MGNNTSSEMSPPVVIKATAKHTATLIFLHGLGDTGHGWAAGMAEIIQPHVKCVCPTAAAMPVTLNAGYRMPSWFDLYALSMEGPEDESGIKRSAEYLHSLIEEEIKLGIRSDRIVVGGFSQGGAVAIYSALTYAKPLAGIVGLSTWLPLNKQFPGIIKGNSDIPMLQCHGDADPIVPFKWGDLSANVIKTFMKSHEFKYYAGLMHSSCDQEMKDVRDFLAKHLPVE